MISVSLVNWSLTSLYVTCCSLPWCILLHLSVLNLEGNQDWQSLLKWKLSGKLGLLVAFCCSYSVQSTLSSDGRAVRIPQCSSATMKNSEKNQSGDLSTFGVCVRVYVCRHVKHKYFHNIENPRACSHSERL